MWKQQKASKQTNKDVPQYPASPPRIEEAVRKKAIGCWFSVRLFPRETREHCELALHHLTLILQPVPPLNFSSTKIQSKYKPVIVKFKRTYFFLQNSVTVQNPQMRRQKTQLHTRVDPVERM